MLDISLLSRIMEDLILSIPIAFFINFFMNSGNTAYTVFFYNLSY
jgi:hypothetical protein